MNKEELFKELIKIRDEIDLKRDELLGLSWKVDCLINYLHADIKEQSPDSFPHY